MPVTNMTRILNQAKKEKYAIGAFNILDYISMKAVIEAAEENQSPVIVQTSVKTIKFWGYEAIMAWFRELAEKTTVPVAIHLDHCKDLDVIRKCIEQGWTSVMIDASSEPFEKNLELTAEVLKMTNGKNVSVEAELGAIVGVEDDIHVNEQQAHLADLEQSKDFTRKLAIDCFAPAVGTAHGVYHGTPKVAFDLIDKISQATQLPLALHGGTGLSDDVFKKAIALGCAKINISTQLKYAVIDSFCEYHEQKKEDYNPLNVFKNQLSVLKEAISEKIKLFGSAGQG